MFFGNKSSRQYRTETCEISETRRLFAISLGAAAVNGFGSATSTAHASENFEESSVESELATQSDADSQVGDEELQACTMEAMGDAAFADQCTNCPPDFSTDVADEPATQAPDVQTRGEL